MAQVQRHRRAIVAALLGLVALVFAPAVAENEGSIDKMDLYERPVLVVDPDMHTAAIQSQAVDASEHYAITGGLDRNVRVWSVADGTLLQTIWIPVGPNPVGVVNAVAISGDGSTIAVGGSTETLSGEHPIYVFDRETGTLIRRIRYDLLGVVVNLKFSPDGRFLAAAMVGGKGGLRIFDRTNDWNEAFRDDAYESYGISFAPDGRLATASLDAKIRLYEYNPDDIRSTFHPTGDPVQATGGLHPYHIAFSPDGRRLAVGFGDRIAVDILDGATLQHLGSHSPTGLRVPSAGAGLLQIPLGGLSKVAWSLDGLILFATGAVLDGEGHSIVLAWDRSGLGDERRLPDCGDDTAADVTALPSGRVFVASMEPCLGLLNAGGATVWNVQSRIMHLLGPRRQNISGFQDDRLKVSQDGRVVDFRYGGSANAFLRFDMRSLDLSPAPIDVSTYPSINGPVVTTDANHNTCVGSIQTCGPAALPHEPALSGAIGPDGKTYFIGTNRSLNALDKAGPLKWHWVGPDEVLAINASKDNRLVIAAYGDGTIRWHRADDGRELLALQVLSNEKDWVLWTPEGFYEATPGAEDVLKWVTNHGPDQAASTRPVSAIAKLHRPDALRLVLDQLETERAVGIAEVAAARLDVQTVTGSARPPGAVLHVLAIGVDKFGDKAGGLHLDYAAKDAHDVADALLDSQKLAPGKPSLYADVKVTYLPNDKASKTAIEDALDATADSMAKSGTDQDTAVIFVSSHGEMIGDQFYLIPYGFVANGTRNAATDSAVPASVFAEKVSALAAHGKVLVLLDACHSGAVGAGGWATDPNAKVLQDAMDFENVTVLTSSKRSELSEELPEWKHGALAQAFLDALAGAADSKGIVTRSALTDAMENEVQSLTKGRQHLGMHVNFSGDLFVASHY